MKKAYVISARLTGEEFREFDRQAKALNMSRSDFARLLLTGDFLNNNQSMSPAEQLPDFVEFDERLSVIESQLREVNNELASSASAFNMLLEQLGEFLRIPNFSEFRARMYSEGVEQRSGETFEDYLLRLAIRYYDVYGVWPDPSNTRAFGRVPPDVDLRKFPKTPPKS